MAASCIRRNQVIDWEGRTFRLTGLLPSGHWQLASTQDGTLDRIDNDELLAKYRLGKIRLRVVKDDDSNLSAAMREATDPPLKIIGKAKKADRLIVLKNEVYKQRKADAHKQTALMKVAIEYPLGSVIQEMAMREQWPKIFGVPAPEKLPSVSSIDRWQRELEKSGFDYRSQIKKHHLKGRTKEPIDEEVAEIIHDATEDVYMTQNKRPMKDVEAEVIDRVRAANSTKPADKQLAFPLFERIKEHIYGLPEFDKFAARHGLPAAQRKFRAVLTSVFAKNPLDRVELDATPLNFIAVDDYGMPLGRPWLHVCIDVRTRCILGYYISYEPPSLATLFECLKHAILPKDNLLLKEMGVANPYRVYGVMQDLVMDNAFENHSDSLYDLVNTWGGDIQFCPRRKPWYKAKIERFIRTFSEQVCQILPGTTFADIFERGDYDAVENAIISWRDIERIVAIWIVDVYHKKQHKTLQCSPSEAWSALVSADSILIPCDVKDVEQVCRIPEIKRLTHQGIGKLGLFWNSVALQEMRCEVGSEIDVRIFVCRMNLGTIGVEHPVTREIIEVKAVAFEYANNLTLHQHEVTRAYTKRFSKSRVESVADWIDAQHRILEIINAARALKGYCLPANASRFLLGNGQRVLPDESVPAIDHETLAIKEEQRESMNQLVEAAARNEAAAPTRKSVTFESSARPKM